MEADLLFSDLPEALQGEIDAFTNTDSRSPHEAEGVGLQGIGITKLLLQALILLLRKWSGQIAVTRGEVFATNEVGWERMPLVG
jgi:hypothetical protein